MTHIDTTAAALLRAILLHPAEDTPRLVFADWLQERDDPRAEGWRFTAHRLLVPEFSHRYGTYEWSSSETGSSRGAILRGRLFRAVSHMPAYCNRPRPGPREIVGAFGARLNAYYTDPLNRVGLFDALDSVALAYSLISQRFRGML